MALQSFRGTSRGLHLEKGRTGTSSRLNLWPRSACRPNRFRELDILRATCSIFLSGRRAGAVRQLRRLLYCRTHRRFSRGARGAVSRACRRDGTDCRYDGCGRRHPVRHHHVRIHYRRGGGWHVLSRDSAMQTLRSGALCPLFGWGRLCGRNRGRGVLGRYVPDGSGNGLARDSGACKPTNPLEVDPRRSFSDLACISR